MIAAALVYLNDHLFLGKFPQAESTPRLCSLT